MSYNISSILGMSLEDAKSALNHLDADLIIINEDGKSSNTTIFSKSIIVVYVDVTNGFITKIHNEYE